MSDRWFYQEDGTGYGPMPEADIRALVDAGAIEPTAMVRNESDENWIPLSKSILSNSREPEPTSSPPGSVSDFENAQQTPREHKGKDKLFFVGIVVLAIGSPWYFFGDQIKMAFRRVTSSDVRKIDSVLAISAEIRAKHLQAAIQFPQQPAEQASFLTGELRVMDVSACPETFQVTFRDYINAWDPFVVPKKEQPDFRPILLAIGKGNSTSFSSSRVPTIVNAYNALVESAKADGVYIKPID